MRTEDPQGSGHGLNSMIAALLAIALVLFARHVEAYRGARTGYLLSLADGIGLVGPSRLPQPEIKSPSLLLVTDELGITGLYGFTIYLALCSIGFALWAEKRGEPNLYLSGGCTLATSALVLVNYPLGLASMFVSAALLLYLRAGNAVSKMEAPKCPT